MTHPQQQRRQHFEKACAELNIQCVKGSLAELVKQGVSGIVLTFESMNLVREHARTAKCCQPGMPGFSHRRCVGYGRDYSVTIDQHEWAMISLDWLMSKTGEQEHSFYSDAYPDYHRGENFEKYFSQYPSATVVAGFEPGQKLDAGWVKRRTGDFAEQMPDLKRSGPIATLKAPCRGSRYKSGLQFDQWPVLPCEATNHGLSVREVDPTKAPRL